MQKTSCLGRTSDETGISAPKGRQFSCEYMTEGLNNVGSTLAGAEQFLDKHLCNGSLMLLVSQDGQVENN
jgi:hypothetical protein